MGKGLEELVRFVPGDAYACILDCEEVIRAQVSRSWTATFTSPISVNLMALFRRFTMAWRQPDGVAYDGFEHTVGH